MDHLLDEIKAATHWHDVKKVDDAYVITFDFKDFRHIIGLARGEEMDSFYLNFDSLRQVPISFLVSLGSSTVQYWTLNQRLHRTGGRPALTSITPEGFRPTTETYTIARRWFWNGMPHRLDGPAVQKINGYQASINEGYLTESWDGMNLIWIIEGQPACYPHPQQAKLFNGSCVRDARTKQYHQSGDYPAFHADEATFHWQVSSTDEFKDHLVPLCAEISGFREYYERGKLINRDADHLEMEWSHRGKDLSKITDLNSFIDALMSTGLLRKLDFWKGPFYSRAGIELMVLTEFQKWCDLDESSD